MKPDRWKRAQFAHRSCLGKMMVGFTGFILALSIAAGSAWSLEESTKSEQVSQASLYGMKGKPASVWTLAPGAGDDSPAGPKKQIRNSSIDGSKAGDCPSLLKTVRHTPLKPSVDDGPRSGAGAAAVLGYAFGMRYALTPPAGASLAKGRGTGACS